eukprot:1584644-Amphidinium_carterae.1
MSGSLTKKGSVMRFLLNRPCSPDINDDSTGILGKHLEYHQSNHLSKLYLCNGSKKWTAQARTGIVLCASTSTLVFAPFPVQGRAGCTMRSKNITK